MINGNVENQKFLAFAAISHLRFRRYSIGNPMQAVKFKLKQASAVLGVSPKDLQNLVQLGVISPPRRNNLYWFDYKLLLEAKVAFYLKASLGSSSELLARFTEALAPSLGPANLKNIRDIRLQSRPVVDGDAVEIKIPLRSLAEELNQQLPRAAGFKDLPKGRKRSGWKEEFWRSLKAAAAEMGDVSEEQILKTIHEYRAERKKLRAFKQAKKTQVGSVPGPPRSAQTEITIIARTKKKTA